MSRGFVVCRKGSISRSRTEECSVFDFEPSIQVRGVFKNHLRASAALRETFLHPI